MPGARRARKTRGPYRTLHRDLSAEHPIHAVLESLRPQRRLRRRIQQASQRLLDALGDRRLLWLELEERLAEYRDLREQAHFDAGFAHGFAAGRAEAVRSVLGGGMDGDCLAQRARECAMLEETLSPRQRALALLQAAWAVGFERERDTDCRHCRGCGAGSPERE